MTPTDCNKTCVCCDESVAEIQAAGEVRRTTIMEYAKATITITGALAVCVVFVGVVGCSCYAQLNRLPFEFDLALMGFLFVCVGALLGVSAKDLARACMKVGGK